MKILVVGGTGFVGRSFIDKAKKKLECDIISLSRRGKLPQEKDSSVKWLAGDAADLSYVEKTISDYGPFDACVHTAGLLLDTSSGLSSLNKYASGSGSIPTTESTYDRVTRQTSFNLIETFSKLNPKKPLAFIFISAAEAGWTLRPPIGWLNRYLDAKLAVETKLQLSPLREVIFRPSLIWTKERPQAFVSVAPFMLASSLGVPFVEMPVPLDDLTSAMVHAITNPTVQGKKQYPDIKELAKKV